MAGQQQPSTTLSTEHPATCAGFPRSPGTVPSAKPFQPHEYTVPRDAGVFTCGLGLWAVFYLVPPTQPPAIQGMLSVLWVVSAAAAAAAAADGFQATSCFFVTSQRGKEAEGWSAIVPRAHGHPQSQQQMSGNLTTEYVFWIFDHNKSRVRRARGTWGLVLFKPSQIQLTQCNCLNVPKAVSRNVVMGTEQISCHSRSENQNVDKMLIASSDHI